MIAMALVHNPDVLIADEPTTALDVTVQAQIVELIDRVKKEFDIGVILITHDLGVVAETATHVMVMYAGRATRVRPGERDLQRGAASVHVGPARVDADGRPAARAPDRDRGLAAVAAQPAAGLRRSIRAASTASSRATRSVRRSRRCPAATSTPATCRPSASARSGRSASASSWAWSDAWPRSRADVGTCAATARRPARRGRAPDEALPRPPGRVRAREGRRPRGRGRDA